MTWGAPGEFRPMMPGGTFAHEPHGPPAPILASTECNRPRRPDLVYDHNAVIAGPLMSNEETTRIEQRKH
jgi:hypothetical protein